MTKNITFEITQQLGVIYSTIRGRRQEEGWSKEVNIVAWNGGIPKIDIRGWSEDHERCSKGITLSESEAREVMEILQDYFKGKDGE